jgi:hypothetical protein
VDIVRSGWFRFGVSERHNLNTAKGSPQASHGLALLHAEARFHRGVQVEGNEAAEA